MVEHFADAVLKKTSLNYSPDDSIANIRVLGALAEAARTGNTASISLDPDKPYNLKIKNSGQASGPQEEPDF